MYYLFSIIVVHRTSPPEDQRPADHKMRGPQDEDQAAIGSEGTRPEDHIAKGAEDQKALEFMLYVSVHRFYIF